MPKLTKAEERKAAADRRAQVTPLKRTMDEAEKRVAKLQAEVARLDAALNAPDLYAQEPARAMTLTKQRGEAKKQLDAAEVAWLEASEAYETARVGVERDA